ncbi:Fungal trichothecene efflux pump [Niveomyces insectorum RCEF 264]|uniref:Fungal trichothecene efflux pump n=1 Tax=Niveomyces insectorum RCEF 264 TaxID=1081102 RepID=A0A167Y0X9_9HYPO|nr:Fungal trichothecene efflux pump [Niveomyces insectorum RCEF 264]
MAIEMTETNKTEKADHAVHEATTKEDVNDNAQSMVIIPEEDVRIFNTKTAVAFAALCGQFSSYVMTLLIPSSCLAYINADLGPDPNYTWITVSWQLGAAVVVSVGGRLSDIFGRRYFMLTGSLLGIVGCVIGATGKSINQMIGSGVVFGIASGFQEMSYACIQEILPNKYRMIGVGIFDSTLLLSYCSPMIAYTFIAHYSITWRAAYWYMFSYHSVMGILLLFCYFPPNFQVKHRDDGKTKRQLLAELDYVGLALFAASSTLMLLGINFGGGHRYPWKSAEVIAPIVVGFCCAVVLGFWETRESLQYPLLPPALFRKVREFTMVIVLVFIGGMLYYSMNVLWPQQSADFFVSADQLTLRGVYATIFSFGSFSGALIMIFFCARVGREKWQMFGFMVLQTAFIGAMASFASVVGPNVDAVAQQFNLPPSSWTALVTAAKTNTAKAYAAVPGMTDAIEAAASLAVKQSYVQAFKLVYLVAIAFGGVAVIAALFTKNTDSRKKSADRAVYLMTEEIEPEAKKISDAA